MSLNTFKVVDYQSDYRTSRSPYKIIFYATTSVRPCLDFSKNIPEKYMKSFSDVLSGELDRRYLIGAWYFYSRPVFRFLDN